MRRLLSGRVARGARWAEGLLVACSVAAVLSLSGCEIETSDNGRLDGFWLLTTVDTIGGGSADVAARAMTWAFQGRIMELRQADGKSGLDIICQFDHQGDTLLVSHPFIIDRNNEDIRVDDAALLAPFGLTALSESFFVSHLGSESMVLRSTVLQLRFRRY